MSDAPAKPVTWWHYHRRLYDWMLTFSHKPSATAEKHYTVRPLDLLRLHHEKIEAWILLEAGIDFVPAKQPGRLRAVK